MDFTGEVGRLAVAKATERDDTAVRATLVLLQDLLARFNVLDPRQACLVKKMGPLQATCDKVERLVYELSLAKGSSLMQSRLQGGVGGDVAAGGSTSMGVAGGEDAGS
ncbi:hypothetical protein CEUSTIGMA_g11844.t1 [Chlamydomonas eustigma]|uniref:Uncharacterized protein n=1 Tax=Chlamydomonas eustigma TaxID=1157962 RepID=A0A250XN43_9CHLO|nr:hypothetical protein CEUSTIGMA_g11844.t1 [Chlamydomonas eustigma]|eukprot:GAX84423.1 hypothetical protein CEUSTIGMA_g11844.t1 [Chlamydomonas eustigma]